MSKPSGKDIMELVAYDNPACALLLTTLDREQQNEVLGSIWDTYVDKLGEDKARAHMDEALRMRAYMAEGYGE